MKYLLEKIISILIDIIDRYYHMKRLSTYLKKINIDSNSTIFDVGTHKGEYIEFFLRINNSCKIYSFEPQNNLFKNLNNKYHSKNNIYLHNLGLGERKEKQVMNINIKSSTSTLSKLNYESNYLKFKSKILGTNINKMFFKKENVQIQTIDNIFVEKTLDKIDILKIDTLGFEYKVLKGAEKSLQKINLIIIEFRTHDAYLDYNPIMIHDYLEKNNFLLSKSFKFPFMNWEDRIYINKYYKNT